MSDPMNESPNDALSLARFRDLADAYGGLVSRWPEEYRAAAMRMAVQPAAIAILAQASTLDEALDAWAVPLPAQALRDRVIDRAPGPAHSIMGRARLWWSGLGIAAALAGAAAGAAVANAVTPVDLSIGNTTSFGDVGPQES